MDLFFWIVNKVKKKMFVVRIFVLLSSCFYLVRSERVLRLGALYPFSTSSLNDYYAGGVMRQAAITTIMAVEWYNARNGSLTKEFANLDESTCPTRIDLEIGDTWSTPARSYELYIENHGGYHATIGPGRSQCCETLSVVASLDQVPTMSYWASSPTLDQKSFYPYFMRTIPSDGLGAVAAVEWFLKNGFTRIGVLGVQDAYGNGYLNALSAQCSMRNLKCELAAFEESNYEAITTALDVLSSYRIFFGVFHGVDLPVILSEAKKRKMTGSTATWIVTDAVTVADFYNLEPELAEAFAGGGKLYSSGVTQTDWPLYTTFKKIYQDHTLISSTELAQRYNQDYLSNAESKYALIDDDHFIQEGLNWPEANYAYDAVVALALGACASNFSSDAPGFLRAIRAASFDGISGAVSFNELGSRSIHTANFVLENILLDLNTNRLAAPKVQEIWAVDHWEVQDDFIFSTGTTSPPLDTPETSCPPGSIVQDFTCLKCPVGHFQLENTCVVCSGYEFQDQEGQTECIPCGKNSHIIQYKVGSTTRNECTCERGSYSRTFPISDCVSCSGLDAECPGGTCQPYPKPSYWMSPSTQLRAATFRCRQAFFCDGNRRKQPLAASGDNIHLDGSGNRSAHCLDEDQALLQISTRPNHWCKFGRDVSAPLCEGTTHGTSDMNRRYFQLSNLSVRCPVRSHRMRILFTTVCFIVVFVLFLVLNDYIRPRYEVLDVILNTYQDVAIVASFSFFWPRAFEPAFTISNISLFDVDVYEPTCLWPQWSYPEGFWLMLCLPAVYALYATVQTSISLFLYKSMDTADAWRMTLGSILQFLFGALPSLIIKVQSAFQCQKFSGLKRRQFDHNTQKCGHPAHRLRQLFALLYGFGIVLGIPLLVGIKLIRLHRLNRLCDKTILQVYGFLYKSFHSDALAWGAYRLLKQLILATIATSLWYSPFVQCLLGLILIAVLESCHSKLQPSLDTTCNRFERRGLLNVLFLIVLGMIFTAMTALESDTLSKHRQRTERQLFVFFFFAAQVLYLIYGIFLACIDARETECRESARQVLTKHPARPQVNELIDSFKGSAFLNYIKSSAFNQEQALTLTSIDDAITPYVSDESSTNNYSHSLEAVFYRHVDQSFPCLIDTLLCCTEERRNAAREVFALLARATYIQENARFDKSIPLELIDRSSVLFFLLHCNATHRKQFHIMMESLIEANPRLRSGNRRVHALQLALSLQRLYRAKFTEKSLHKALAQYSNSTKMNEIETSYQPITSLHSFVSFRYNSIKKSMRPLKSSSSFFKATRVESTDDYYTADDGV